MAKLKLPFKPNILETLNGTKTGKLYEFIQQLKTKRNPRIAWYPSAGDDFRGVLYLSKEYSAFNPATEIEPEPPDIFLFTDYFPWTDSKFLDTNIIYRDGRTSIEIKHIEELPKLNLERHPEIVEKIEPNHATNRVVYMELEVKSSVLKDFTNPVKVIYAFVENEAFYCDLLQKHQPHISHLIHVRYGGGLGGGGYASGRWLQSVLEKIGCEIYVNDNETSYKDGDRFFMKKCQIHSIERFDYPIIRTIPQDYWSYHGPVCWSKIKE